jgi:hypothetical protein
MLSMRTASCRVPRPLSGGAHRGAAVRSEPPQPDATMKRSRRPTAGPAGSRRLAQTSTHPAPSSRGQGHHPLKVETRVRIPLGLLRGLDPIQWTTF